MPKILYSVEEVLKKFPVSRFPGLSERNLYAACRDGKIAAVKDDDEHWMIPEDGLKKWMGAKRPAPPQGPKKLHKAQASLIPADSAERIKALRYALVMTASEFYDHLDIGGATTPNGKKKTIWQWEQPAGTPQHRKPMPRAWRRILELEKGVVD